MLLTGVLDTDKGKSNFLSVFSKLSRVISFESGRTTELIPTK